jgi:preprotein translocase subunit SecD
MKFSLGYPDASLRTLIFRAFVAGGFLLISLTPAIIAAEPEHKKTILYEIVKKPEAKYLPRANLLAIIENRIKSLKNIHAEARLEKPNRIAVEVSVTDAEKLPNAMKTVERLLAFTTGHLEFRILANRRDHPALIKEAEKETKKDRLLDELDEPLAWWAPVAPGVDPKPYQNDKDILVRQRKMGKEKVTEVLLVNDPNNVTGRHVPWAGPGLDEQGHPVVLLQFNETGGQLFGRLTSSNLPYEDGFRRRLGILVDGNLCSAPYIPQVITTRAEISGNFTKTEVEDLCRTLKYKPLPVRLKKVGYK